jgi:ferredoxin
MYENAHVATTVAPPDSTILTATHEDASNQTHHQVRQFVDALYEPSDILEFRILPSRQSKWTLASTVDDVIPWLIEMNGEGQSIYVGCNPRSCEGDGSKSANCTGCGRCTKCVSVCRSLCIDIENTSLSEFHFKFKECDLPAPTVTLTSGAGIHCYWRLDEEIQPQQWSQYQRGIMQAAISVDLDVDLKIKDPPRVMRVPGFINHKRHNPAKLINVTKEATYPLDDFPTPPEQPPDKVNAKPSNGKSKPSIVDEIHGSETDIIKAQECLDRLSSVRCDDYGSWIDVGMALHAIFTGERVFQIWHEWSKKSSSYVSEQDCRQHWDTFSAKGNGTGRLGVGSLIHWVREDNGEVDDLAWKPIPATALPFSLRKIADVVAASMGVDPAGFILPALSIAATAIGASRAVRPKPGWEMVPILWAVIIAYSGGKKSPPFHAAVNFLRMLDDVSCKEHEEAMKKYEQTMIEYKQLLNASKHVAPLKPEKPVCERHHTSVATLQAVHRILSENARGICVANDELSGWINAMDQFTTAKGADLSSWLELYNGHGTTVDRASKEPMRIPKTSVNVTGTITKNQWQESMTGTNASNGLAPRFLIAMPPKKYQRWTEVGIDPSVIAEYEAMIQKLLSLTHDADDKPIIVGWTADAAVLWGAFYDENVTLQERESDGYLESLYSKLEGQAAKLALVIQMVRWTEDQSLSNTEIDADSMRMTIELTRWFRRESRRVYLILNQDRRSDEEETVYEYVASHEDVSVRDLQRNLLREKSSDHVEQIVEGLVKKGRLKELSMKQQGRGRRARRFNAS